MTYKPTDDLLKLIADCRREAQAYPTHIRWQLEAMFYNSTRGQSDE